MDKAESLTEKYRNIAFSQEHVDGPAVVGEVASDSTEPKVISIPRADPPKMPELERDGSALLNMVDSWFTQRDEVVRLLFERRTYLQKELALVSERLNVLGAIGAQEPVQMVDPVEEVPKAYRQVRKKQARKTASAAKIAKSENMSAEYSKLSDSTRDKIYRFMVDVKKAVTNQDISDAIGLSAPTVQVYMLWMVKRGHVTRVNKYWKLKNLS